MPFFRAADRLVYYAHVPKCGGSAIEQYLGQRFGRLGLYQWGYFKLSEAERWSRTSPQHVDAQTLEQMMPTVLFDDIFTVVRHPVARLVSIYHFQREMEGRILAETGFSEWLAQLDAKGPERFTYDNHVLPMAQMVPEDAIVFHLEHGLEALVPWFDKLAGDTAGPRSVAAKNTRSKRAGADEKVIPTAEDIARIARIYAADFSRFGYRPDEPAPLAAAPEAPPELRSGPSVRDRVRAARPPLRVQIARYLRRG